MNNSTKNGTMKLFKTPIAHRGDIYKLFSEAGLAKAAQKS